MRARVTAADFDDRAHLRMTKESALSPNRLSNGHRPTDLRGFDCAIGASSSGGEHETAVGPVQRMSEITGIGERFGFVADSGGAGHQPARDDAMPANLATRHWTASTSAVSDTSDGMPAIGGIPDAAVGGGRQANRGGLEAVPPLEAQPRRGRARQKSAGDIALLDIHPDLAGDLSPQQRLAVRNALTVPAIEVERGTWHPAACTEDERIVGPVLGVQVLSGVLVHEVLLGARASAQIFGPGDLMKVHDGRGEQSLPVISTVSVFEPAVLAVLDDRLLSAAQRWPRLAGGMLAQAMRQLDHAAQHQAISQLARVEDRLLALFWHLADRWGRVRSDGIAINLSLTHETVGHLVGARRSTVTLGLLKLRDQQLLRRDEDGVWLLAHASLQRLTNHQGQLAYLTTGTRTTGLNT